MIDKKYQKVLEKTLWDLHIHTFNMEKEIKGWKKEPKEVRGNTGKQFFNKCQQQIGMITMLCSILRDNGTPEMPNKIWQIRKWELDKTGNHIITKKC